jgi:hypothetical protein
MDALSHIDPVARKLLDRVDAALVGLGAPAEHRVWVLLRRIGATPGEVTAFFLGVDPALLLAAASALRGQIREYAAAQIPTSIGWRGAAGEAFTAQAVALARHLGGEGNVSGDDASLCGRLDATASYVEDIADWYTTSRALVARSLADVLTSTQAVTVRSCNALDGLDDPALLPGRVPAGAVLAAADIAAHVLSAAVTAHEAGHDLERRWGPRLGELPYRAPALTGPARLGATIDLHH